MVPTSNGGSQTTSSSREHAAVGEQIPACRPAASGLRHGVAA